MDREPGRVEGLPMRPHVGLAATDARAGDLVARVVERDGPGGAICRALRLRDDAAQQLDRAVEQPGDRTRRPAGHGGVGITVEKSDKSTLDLLGRAIARL